MASIENVFDYFSRYGPSVLKSEECQLGTLGPFKWALKSKKADKIGEMKKMHQKDVYTEESVAPNCLHDSY